MTTSVYSPWRQSIGREAFLEAGAVQSLDKRGVPSQNGVKTSTVIDEAEAELVLLHVLYPSHASW